MRRFVRSLTLFSAVGFVLSLIVHILGLLNMAPHFGWFAILLHIGLFGGGFGALIAFFHLRQSEGRGFWTRALKASPAWMK